jgi:hypothetical protein
MYEAYMINRYSGIVEWEEVEWGPKSLQGLKLFVKYEDLELHLWNFGWIPMDDIGTNNGILE